MNEPTMKEIAEWLREAAEDAANQGNQYKYNYYEDRSAQVEEIGERMCLTCEWWNRQKEHKGVCRSNKFKYEECDEDGLEYWDYESYSAGFYTGERFGCIHWKRK